MGTCCQLDFSDEDDKMLDEARKSGWELPECFENVDPEVERAIEQRTIECLQENVANARNELIENFTNTDIERLDLGVEPSQEEYRLMFEVGKELGMTKDLEIIDMPAITGIKDPEQVMLPEEIAGKIQRNKIGVADVDQIIKQMEEKTRENHIDTETMRALMKETLDFLKKSKIPSEWRNQATINMIVFVDKQMGRTRGEVFSPAALQVNPKLSRNIYIPRDPQTNQLPRGERLYWTLAHEIFHINEPRIEEIFDKHTLEWVRAETEQGKITDYSIEKSQQEYRAECFAAWVNNSTELCPEMQKFFDRHFKE